VVAFLFSILLTILMIGILVAVAKRREPGTYLTWGEAFIAATFVFTLLFMAYGVVPHQWLAWADNELGWRSDSLGVPTPFGRIFENGVAFGGRGRIIISAQIIRDLIATLIYVIFLVGQVVGWLWWQRRGKGGADQKELTSAYGRPLIRGS
jgi:hypothetical protein